MTYGLVKPEALNALFVYRAKGNQRGSLQKKMIFIPCDINVQAIKLLFHAVKLLLHDRDFLGRIGSWNAMRGMSEISALYTTGYCER